MENEAHQGAVQIAVNALGAITRLRAGLDDSLAVTTRRTERINTVEKEARLSGPSASLREQAMVIFDLQAADQAKWADWFRRFSEELRDGLTIGLELADDTEGLRAVLEPAAMGAVKGFRTFRDSVSKLPDFTTDFTYTRDQLREALDFCIGCLEGVGQYAKTGSIPDSWGFAGTATRVDDLALLLSSLPSGTHTASAFHSLAARALTFAFRRQLLYPILEYPVNYGRKRIDIAFTNSFESGFFKWLSTAGHECPNVFAECKNYSSDPANPEVDQLAGRFMPGRGRVGLLVMRSLENPDRLFRRCNDVHRSQSGLILPITDEDLVVLHDARPDRQFRHLKAIYDKVVQ